MGMGGKTTGKSYFKPVERDDEGRRRWETSTGPSCGIRPTAYRLPLTAYTLASLAPLARKFDTAPAPPPPPRRLPRRLTHRLLQCLPRRLPQRLPHRLPQRAHEATTRECLARSDQRRGVTRLEGCTTRVRVGYASWSDAEYASIDASINASLDASLDAQLTASFSASLDASINAYLDASLDTYLTASFTASLDASLDAQLERRRGGGARGALEVRLDASITASFTSSTASLDA